MGNIDIVTSSKSCKKFHRPSVQGESSDSAENILETDSLLQKSMAKIFREIWTNHTPLKNKKLLQP